MPDSEKPPSIPAVSAATIVGGRPSAEDRAEAEDHIGVLLASAAVDPSFSALLMTKRSEAAEALGIVLRPEERDLIDRVEPDLLSGMIRNTEVAPRDADAIRHGYGADLCRVVRDARRWREFDGLRIGGIRPDMDVQMPDRILPGPTIGIRPDLPLAPGNPLRPAWRFLILVVLLVAIVYWLLHR